MFDRIPSFCLNFILWRRAFHNDHTNSCAIYFKLTNECYDVILSVYVFEQLFGWFFYTFRACTQLCAVVLFNLFSSLLYVLLLYYVFVLTFIVEPFESFLI